MNYTSVSFQKKGPDPEESISLSEVIAALSLAIELSDGAMHGHALRSCLLGMRIAEEAGVTPAEKSALYYALLLKDVGNESMVGLRSDRGASIVSKLGMGSLAANAIRYIEERWDGSGQPEGLHGESIPRLARLCSIAQHLDMFAIARSPEAAVETVKELSGLWFDPALVEVTRSLARRGELWTHCMAGDSHEKIRAAVLERDPHERHCLDDEQIDRICEGFAEIVDAKSHFTFRHSMGVAELAHGIALNLHLPEDRIRLVWRAALLHDLGKLSIPNRILDKKAELTASEWRIVKRHPGLTRKILDRIEPFREIAVVAGEHHEKLDGSGYPKHLRASDLSVESRIIAVADVYGALSEERPYRAKLSREKILPILESLAPHKLDADCVRALEAFLEQQPLPGFEPGAASDDQDDQKSRYCA